MFAGWLCTFTLCSYLISRNSPSFLNITLPCHVFCCAAAANRGTVIQSVVEVLSQWKRSLDKSLISATCCATLAQRDKEGGGVEVRWGRRCIPAAHLWCNSSFFWGLTWGSGAPSPRPGADVLRISNALFPLCLFKLHPAAGSQTMRRNGGQLTFVIAVLSLLIKQWPK